MVKSVLISDLRRMTHTTTVLQSVANRITYPGDCGTPTADMLTTKVLLDSVISTKGARFMTIDIRDFYPNTPMVCPKYMRLKVSDIPDPIIALYNLD
eukprot:CCRYP_001898-RB/>CCRYP_001898-RB protein AED:0.46 eAED:0.46 QI:0/-1/0/1/-1/0/1/0/96